jgi:N-carbamoyl-L-amino-acid hydrolase
MSAAHPGELIAVAVSEQCLWDRLMAVARIGGLPNGGVNRQALTPADTEAKNHIIGWAATQSLKAFQDEAGNLYIRLEGTDTHAPPVLLGSHLDSQPTGGKFDGAYGVIAGLEVLRAIRSLGLRPSKSIEVVAWTNEEGSRFLPGATGSSAFAGTRRLETMLQAETTDGTKVADDLQQSIDATHAPLRPMSSIRPAAYLEAHIEQGPILEQEGVPIGIVEGIQGVRRIAIEVTGETAHAGTMPHRLRKDALAAATRIMSALHPLTTDGEDVLRLTFGRLQVWPNSPNTVPGRVELVIDLRHPIESTIESVSERIRQVVDTAAPPCRAAMRTVSTVPPVHFDADIRARLTRASDALGYTSRPITSGAGHDALHLARVCTTGMIFVPCRDGVSHHESESATPEQLAAGARVLAAAAWELAET